MRKNMDRGLILLSSALNERLHVMQCDGSRVSLDTLQSQFGPPPHSMKLEGTVIYCIDGLVFSHGQDRMVDNCSWVMITILFELVNQSIS